MSLDHAILGFLSRGEITGYDLKTRCFDRDAAAFWTADQAQIYRTLDRLERSGLVSSRIVPQHGRPDRKVFELTPEGRRALREWLATPHPIPPVREPLLLQLHFSDELTDDAVLALIETARDGYQRRLEKLRRETARRGPAAPSSAGEEAKSEARRIALEGTLATTRATIDWLDDCAERVSARNSTSTPMRG